MPRSQVIMCVVIVILSSILLGSVCDARLSGFYTDNGIDRTVLHRTMDRDDQQEVEHEILELLGLPDRPRKHQIHPSLRKSAPQFLLDIYRRLAEEDNNSNNGASPRSTRSTPTENLITEIDRQVIDQSDIIMTFLNKNHHVSEVRHERGRRIWFDVSEVSKELSLMMAELRVYQKEATKPLKNSSHHNHHQYFSPESREIFTISVYDIIKMEDGHKELELLAAVNTTSDHIGWLELNVTGALSRWIGNLPQNRGLYISAHTINRPDHEIRLDDIGLVNVHGDEEFQPFMVGFFKGQDHIHPARNMHSRTKRNTKRRRTEARNNPYIDHRQPDTKSCQIQQLYVSFKDLKWQDWIIAPDGYGAYFCSGECDFPLNSHMNATNHAIVQTLVHLLHPSKVPKPCCAPTKLSAISVLFFIDESNVNLKKYKNMVVKSCGCH
uniref:Glass bottom boat n=1 Tax=Clogmia albipunctata TaxID=85120 RepID=W5U0I7_CLOAL|nr:glass bottom boat [Clogmia albipunctata]